METNKKIIYIVTSGEYSDYGIDAVFTTKEKANEYVQQYGTECRIEEYELDKEYFDKGCERFKQETSQLSLFK